MAGMGGPAMDVIPIPAIHMAMIRVAAIRAGRGRRATVARLEVTRAAGPAARRPLVAARRRQADIVLLAEVIRRRAVATRHRAAGPAQVPAVRLRAHHRVAAIHRRRADRVLALAVRLQGEAAREGDQADMLRHRPRQRRRRPKSRNLNRLAREASGRAQADRRMRTAGAANRIDRDGDNCLP